MAREYLVLVAATLVWGSAHPTVKFALASLTSLQLALLRPLCACIVLSLVVVATGRTSRVLVEARRQPKTLIALGVLGYALSGSFTAAALSLLPAGVTALVSNASPLIVVVGSVAVFGERVGVLPIAGALVGFTGLALLSAGDLDQTGDLPATLIGSALALGSATAWAIYTAVARRLGGADPIITTAITSGIGSIAVGLIAIPTQDWTRLATAPAPVLLSAVWAGTIATGGTYAAWSYALRHLPAITVAPFAYLVPVSALIISHIWLGEAWTPAVLVGAALVLLGVALTQALNFHLLLRARYAKR